MINNRQQSGRRRGRGGQRQGGGNPGAGGGGNRIDNRARGNANQLYEKYKNLASDAQRQGDRVQTEYYLQFADHYYRVLAETRPRFEEQQRQRARDEQYDEDGEFDADDYGEEGEAIRPGEQLGQPPRANGDDRQHRFDDRRPRRDDEDRRPRREEEARRSGREDEGRRPGRDDEVRRSGRDDEGRRAPREDDGRRAPRDRDDGPRMNGYRAEPQAAAAPPAARADEAEPVLPMPEPDAVQPRRRGRPRKVEDAPVGLDVDRLPPALGAANDAGEPDEAKPRRRRARIAAVESPAAE